MLESQKEPGQHPLSDMTEPLTKT